MYHPEGCTHRRVLGTVACDLTGGKWCEGGSEAKCDESTGKTILVFPRETDDAHNWEPCISGSSTNWADVWTTHHYITHHQTNCSQVYGCMWDSSPPGGCIRDTNDSQGWDHAAWPTSHQCVEQ